MWLQFITQQQSDKGTLGTTSLDVYKCLEKQIIMEFIQM